MSSQLAGPQAFRPDTVAPHHSGDLCRGETGAGGASAGRTADAWASSPEATGADERALGRLLTALSTIGICARRGEDRYALTDVGACLDGACRAIVQGLGNLRSARCSRKSWSGMLETVMTGKTAAQLQGSANSFDLMARTPDNVANIQCRDDGPDAAGNAGHPVDAYDFSGIVPFDGRRRRVRRIARRHRAAKPAAARNRFRPSEMRRGRKQPSSAHRRQRPRGLRRRAISFRRVPAGRRCDHPQERDPRLGRRAQHVRSCETVARRSRSGGKLLLVERLMPETPTATGRGQGARAERSEHASRARRARAHRAAIRANCSTQSGFDLAAIYPAGRFNVIEAHPG